jgi:ABC transporter substrate binding protein
VLIPDGFLNVHRDEIVRLAARYRLPAVYPWRFFAEVGGLLSYGADQRDEFRLAATYVDRILKGETPSELPVQAPVKFELVINLRAAKRSRAGYPFPFATAGRRGDRIGRYLLHRMGLLLARSVSSPRRSHTSGVGGEADMNKQARLAGLVESDPHRTLDSIHSGDFGKPVIGVISWRHGTDP